MLDTQAFIYFVLDSPALSRRALSLIGDPATRPLLSIASIWEIAIEVSIGKLILTQPFDVLITRQVEINALTLLPSTLEHLTGVAALPLHHRDPFDRLLAAQSLTEGVPIISGDTAFDRYGVRRLW